MTITAAPQALADLPVFKKGDKVNIINSTMSGTFFLEGRATIVRAVPGVDCQYVVRFDSDKQTVERFVDPAAQDSRVGAYIERLNDSRGGL